MVRVESARNFVLNKRYSADCIRLLSSLSGRPLDDRRGTPAPTITLSTVLSAVRREVYDDGRSTPFWTVYLNPRDINNVRNNPISRRYTVAFALSLYHRPAGGAIGGNMVYWDVAQNAGLSQQELATRVLHEATHNLGFSDTQLDSWVLVIIKLVPRVF